MNILLTDTQREKYKPEIETLFSVCPDTMNRKYERANVQQAFMLNMVCSLIKDQSKILCVGCYEDTAFESLLKLEQDVIGIDPQVNIDLEKFFSINPSNSFDIIFSTSVLEHIEDDELFIKQICLLLKQGGVAVITCDFKNDYKQGDAKPAEDFRLYTKYDLTERLNKVLKNNGCGLYGEINYDGEPDFDYGLHKYSFATFMFTKKK